ncbi:MAG: AIR carboxylase family protein [Candidatus Aenigmarchaeota archaeon]|nr:AIR carboxylase family protein [Candidatus Aenigmarchaeota archaeon]
MNPIAVLVMGSESDLADAITVEEKLADFNVPTTRHILSAHRNTGDVIEMVHDADQRYSPLVYVAVVGKKPDLGPVIAGSTDNPVVMYVKKTDPVDFYSHHLLSALDAPPGISYAVFSDPANAALCVAKIMGLHDPNVRKEVGAYRVDRAGRNTAANMKYSSMTLAQVKDAIKNK